MALEATDRREAILANVIESEKKLGRGKIPTPA